MAISRDPVLDQLRRSHSLSSGTSLGVKTAVSEQASLTLSLEGLEPGDIDAIVNKRWKLEEVIGPVRSRLAILTGGRDKRGAPIITITCTEHSNVRASNIGKLLSYLSKVVDDSLQGKGFTIILDMQRATWVVTKRTLKALHLTFVEHIHHCFVIKPQAFWQKHRVGVNFSLQKAKYNFPVVLLDSSVDLFHYLQLTQVHKELGGTLVYNHDEWITAQRCLERYVIDLKCRLESFETLREQLEHPEDPVNLNEARDAVRRHVEARQHVDKADLDSSCEAAIHAVSKLKGCRHPDIAACFNHIDELCGILQSTRERLQQLWDGKGAKLDQVLQLRIFENDTRQLTEWVEYEQGSLSHQHTDIGSSPSTAQRASQSFEEFRARLKIKYQELIRVIVLGERLVSAKHYATEQIKSQSIEVKGRWDRLSTLVDQRASLFSLSISFFDRQQKFFADVEEWSDTCMTKECPGDVEGMDQVISSHKQLKETYQSCYVVVREEGHKIIELLRKPIGDSSLPQAFVVRTRAVKEILESLFDENNWLDEQWTRRNTILDQTLHLRKYQREAKEVHDWLSAVGNPFLSDSNSIGETETDTQDLLEKHDAFERTTNSTYSIASQLFTKATHLANVGQCNPDKIEKESASLEGVVNSFASRLDGRREIILHAQENFKKIDTLLTSLHQLTSPVTLNMFDGPISDVEVRLEKYQFQRATTSSLATDTYNWSEVLIKRLQEASQSAENARTVLDYSTSLEFLKTKVEQVRTEEREILEVCSRRERRWNLSILFSQFEPDVEKHLVMLESWTQEQEHSDWEPADNTMDAQLHLDAFQRQFDQLITSHNDLVTRGRSIAGELAQLDLVMFGTYGDGSTRHPAVLKVEVHVTKLEAACYKMKSVSKERMKKLKDCLQYFLLQQRATKLTSALSSLSASLSLIAGVGQTLVNAQLLQQQATELNQKTTAICSDIDQYCSEVEDCITRRHYQSKTLGVLARSLQEKKGGSIRSASDKLKIVSASAEFHQNVKNLFSSMERCQSQFSSKETGRTKEDIEKLVRTSNELRTFIQQATGVVQSQGQKLIGIVVDNATKHPPKKTFSLDDFSPHQSPMRARRLHSHSDVLTPQIEETDNAVLRRDKRLSDNNRTKDRGMTEKRRASFDVLDSKHDTIYEDERTNASPVKPHPPGSPKLLVNPKRTRPGIRAASSVPSLAPSVVKGQEIIDELLQNVTRRMGELEGLWEGRKKRLEQWEEVIGFREAAPKVIEWVEKKGDRFLDGKNNFGRSIEEVKSLMRDCRSFEDSEVVQFSEQVHKLETLYQTIEASGGQGTLNELRLLHSRMDNKWSAFERDFRRYMTKLELSLKFQEVLFEASNWCQTSQTFLDSMEDKIDHCTTSSDTTSLLEELSVYMTVTEDEQNARVEQLKHTTEFLHSNLLVDLTNQISRSTSRTMSEFNSCRKTLQILFTKFTQIEGEKDREQRLTKQRERVMDELLQTEISFVADLKLILKCRPRFLAGMLPNSLKGKEGIIFGNISEIEAFHRTCLLPRLQDNCRDVDATASLFVEFAEDMATIYVPFCKDKSASEELLASHRSYLNRVQSLFVTDTPLSSLLIKPVQRITKYPLLLKDVLKYTAELGEPTSIIEEAVEAVERIPVATNDAIHLSFLDNATELVQDLGDLRYQSTLVVSDLKFGIKAEKERQVFGFKSALLFAKKVEVERHSAKFKYEYKFKLPISQSIQVLEFIEGEPSKFALVTGDSRIYLKASSVDVKHSWVKTLRLSILEKTTVDQKTPTIMEANGGTLQSLLSVENLTKDLHVPSPYQSPVPVRKQSDADESIEKSIGGESVTGFEKYVVKEDFHHTPSSTDDIVLSLSKGDIVEVLDNNIDGKWFVRTQPAEVAGTMDHGWVPSSILEPIETETTDGGKKGWVQITAGPLSATSDEEKWKVLKQNQNAFGSHDLASQQVISALKKVTFGVEEETSLDRAAVRGGRARSNTLPELTSDISSLEPPMSLSPRSPGRSPNPSPKSSPRPDRRHTESSIPVFESEASDQSKSRDWTKSQWRHKGIRRKKSTGRSASISSDISEETADALLHNSSSEDIKTDLTEAEPSEVEDTVKVEKAHQKIKFIMAELLETEKDYVKRLEQCVNGYMKEMKSPNLPDALKGKEKLIFGNIQDVYKFHNKTFLQLIEDSNESLENTAKCFLEQAHQFEVYVVYCENKPKSESFLWTYQHTGGTFFEEVQNQLGHRQGIDSFLIKPVQRITKYKLLLADLHKTACKVNLETPNLEKALGLMQDVPKRANDAMTISMIYGYDGNIHANGQIIAQDEFTVYERSRWTAARRHVFLLDQRLIITKEKDADGLYVYKDSLKVHSLSVAEKEGDNPSRFAVGTGPIGSWDQYYVLEASSPEKKQQWVQNIKDILKGQFELLRALKGPRPRSTTFDVSSLSSASDSVAMINVSDDSEQDDDEFRPTPSKSTKGHTPSTCPAWSTMPRLRGQTHSFGEPTPTTPTAQARSFNLYVVAEDCAPPKDNEGIMYIKRGQVFDVLDNSSDWWLARLVRDTSQSKDKLGQQGWVPGSFLDKYKKQLTAGEEEAFHTVLQQKKVQKHKFKKRLSQSSSLPTPESSAGNAQKKLHVKSNSVINRRFSPKRKKSNKDKNKVRFTSSLSFQEDMDKEAMEERVANGNHDSKPPGFLSQLSNETVIAGRSVQFKCRINPNISPAPKVEWSHDSQPLSIDRAFSNIGEEVCVLRISDVQTNDEGLYMCTVSNKNGAVTSKATLIVLSRPNPPGQPGVKPLTSTSVRLSWEPPSHTGHSSITIYLVECKDTVSDRWSTLMKRITEPSTVVDDLMPGTKYIFRVIAGNHIGSSEPSAESASVQMARSPLSSEFSLDPFDDHYELQDEIGRGRFGVVYECLHTTTQQTYAAKLLPLDVGREHAQHELEMLGKIGHPNLTQMASAYLTQRHFIILFQLIRGVNLFEYFVSRDHMTETEAAACISQSVSALCYLHQSNIAHLDIKPENIIAVEAGGSNAPDIKLIHFERSKVIDPDSNLLINRLEEHIEYEAPEILLDHPVSMATDMWSLGAVVYTLLGGSSPFLVDSLDLTKDNIINTRLSFPAKTFRGVSESAKDLIAKLLVKEKSKRLLSLQCLRHPWLDNIHPPVKKSPSLNLDKLKLYASSRKWQNSMNLISSSLSRL